jgi:integrase
MTNRNGEFGNTRLLQSGKWQARYRDRSGQDQTGPTTFRTERLARKYLNRVEIELEQGTWLDPRKAKQPFADMVLAWRASRPTIRPTTQASYAGNLSRYLLPYFGDMRANEITADVVREWHAWVSALQRYDGSEKNEGKVISPNTVAKAYRLLRAICEVAVDDGVMPKNPCRLRGVASERTPEQRVATADEVHRICEAIGDDHKAMVMVAAYGGLRLGEIIGLRRHRIDFKANTIRVVEQVTQPDSRTFVVGPPKTDAGVRTVTMPAEVMTVLRIHVRANAEKGRTGLVFPAPNGGHLRRSNFYRRTWLPAVTKAGVEKLRFHDLRHTHATLAVAMGTDIKTLMKRMGHASPRAALIYQHAQSDDSVALGFSQVIAEAAASVAAAKVAGDPSDPDTVGTKLARGDLRVVE